MLQKLCILLVCFAIVGCQTEKREKIEWEKHEFPIYSIELPASWPIEPSSVSMSGDTTDYSKLNFQENKRMRRWGFVRRSLLLQSGDYEQILANMISIFIESRESKTEKPFSIEQEAMEKERLCAVRREDCFTTMKKVSATDDEIRYEYKQESRLIPSGKKSRTEGFRVFKQDGGIVHYIEVSAGSEYMKKHSEAKAIMERILASFTTR